MREYEFSLTRVLPYKDKIYDFVFISENTSQWKPLFSLNAIWNIISRANFLNLDFSNRSLFAHLKYSTKWITLNQFGQNIETQKLVFVLLFCNIYFNGCRLPAWPRNAPTSAPSWILSKIFQKIERLRHFYWFAIVTFQY